MPAECSGDFLWLVAAISWLFAMNSDHYSTEKKVAQIMGEEVHDARLQILGEDDQPDTDRFCICKSLRKIGQKCWWA
jgi:hypothetical protein